MIREISIIELLFIVLILVGIASGSISNHYYKKGFTDGYENRIQYERGE